MTREHSLVVNITLHYHNPEHEESLEVPYSEELARAEMVSYQGVLFKFSAYESKMLDAHYKEVSSKAFKLDEICR